jgi:O-antigen/teichoic acid export membrane protein
MVLSGPAYLRRLTFLPLGFVGSVLPAMSKYFQNNKRTFLGMSYERTLKYLFIMIIPIAVGFSLLSKPIIHLVYGANFDSSVILLGILGWMLVFSFMNHSAMIAFAAIDREKTFVHYQAIGTMANLVFGVLLILLFNAAGLCVANVISQGIIFCLSSFELSKFFKEINIYRILIRPFCSAVIMGVFICIFFRLGLLILIPVAALVYISCLVLLKTFNINELSTLKTMFLNKKIT